MLDHPVTQKLLVTVGAGAFLAIGGTAWQSNLQLERHETRLQHMEDRTSRSEENIADILSALRTDTSDIKRDVAVLVERTEALKQRQDAAEDEQRKFRN